MGGSTSPSRTTSTRSRSMTSGCGSPSGSPRSSGGRTAPASGKSRRRPSSPNGSATRTRCGCRLSRSTGSEGTTMSKGLSENKCKVSARHRRSWQGAPTTRIHGYSEEAQRSQGRRGPAKHCSYSRTGPKVRPDQSQRRGFTLVELMVAALMTAFVMSAVTMSLSQLSRAKAGGREQLAAHLRADAALNAVRRDVISVLRDQDLFWTRLLLT
ncbi:MAG: prepilin-type N-terminal cleavage/methylation domain-containing protein, partial [Planctomycetota bacterium]